MNILGDEGLEVGCGMVQIAPSRQRALVLLPRVQLVQLPHGLACIGKPAACSGGRVRGEGSSAVGCRA